MRAGVYCRISSDPTGQRAGVDRQEQDCRALAERQGWEVVRVWVDNDRSAYRGKARPAFIEMTEAMKAGELDVLVAWHPDRLTRQVRELEDLIDLVEATGVQVATVMAGEYDLATATGRMSARIVGAVARHESEHKAERQRRKHLQLAEQGKPVGGTRPFGYLRDKVTPHPEEAPLVSEAAARVLAGESLRGVCVDFQKRGVQTTGGRPMTNKRLLLILTSWRIAGVRSLSGVPMAREAWPALVDELTHRRLRALLLDPARRTNQQSPRCYLLSGFLVCGKCGTKLVSRKSGKVSSSKNGARRNRTYVCSSSPEQGGCGGMRIVAEPLEGYVALQIVERVDGPELARAVAERRSAPDQGLLAAVETEQAALEQLSRDHYVDRVIGREQFLAASKELQARLEGLRSRLALQERQGGAETWLGKGDVLQATWWAMTFDQRRAVVAAVVDRIVVAPAMRGIGRFDERRVRPELGGDIVWREGC